MKQILLVLPFIGISAYAQCTNPVSHISGTQSINGTSVTVTSVGAAIATTLCDHDYWIGKNTELGFPAPGSFTYTFSPPATGISLSMDAIDNWTESEEVALYINGVHFNITQPGSGLNCLVQHLAVINQNGNIGGQHLENGSGWENFEISDIEITTLTIELIIDNGIPNGALYHLNFCNNGLGNAEYADETVGIFPNPMTDYAEIRTPKIDGNAEVMIYNALGQIVKSQSVSKSDFRISRDGLESGLYHVHIYQDGDLRLCGKTAGELTRLVKV